MTRGWDGREPVCEGKLAHRGVGEGGGGGWFPYCNRENVASCLPAVDCGEPPKVANAKLRDPREPSYTYLSVVRYTCQVGILTGSNEVWCTQDGTWSTPPTCKGVHQKPVGGRFNAFLCTQKAILELYHNG